MYANYSDGGGSSLSIESLEPRTLMSAAGGAKVDPVIEWNNVLIGALRADGTLPGPGWASRNAAIMHTAIFDAVDAIDGSHDPFLVHASAPRNTPIDAAVAAAAWRVLSNLYPAQTATFDAALVTTLARVPDGKQENAGVALGVSVADQILAARAGDGSDVVVPYTVGSDPGDWKPTAPDYTPAWGPGWGQVAPFSMVNGAQFRPPTKGATPPSGVSGHGRAAPSTIVIGERTRSNIRRTAIQRRGS